MRSDGRSSAAAAGNLPQSSPATANPLAPRGATGFRWLLGLYWVVLFAATHMRIPPVIAEEVSPFDKVLHAVAYFILTALIVLWDGWPLRLSMRRLIGILLLVAGYAALDEWLQTKVGRFGDMQDWLSDFIGGICALLLARWMRTRTADERLHD